jgi:hypothetical protein
MATITVIIATMAMIPVVTIATATTAAIIVLVHYA